MGGSFCNIGSSYEKKCVTGKKIQVKVSGESWSGKTTSAMG